MSMILEASCANNIVTCEGLPIQGVTILSEGVGPSTGILLMQGGELYYIAKISGDLKTTLDKLTTLIPKLVAIYTSIAGGMTGPTTAPPPTLGTDLAALTLINTELTTLKNMLR